MIAEMYKRRENMAWIFLVGTLVIVTAWGIFRTPKTTMEWIDFSIFLLPILFTIALIILSRHQYHKVRDVSIPLFTESLHSVNHMVIKKDVSFLPRLLLFQKDGRFVGTVRPIDLTWWKTSLLLLNMTFVTILPLRFAIHTHDGKTIGTFEKRGWLRTSELKIFDQQHQPIGRYVQDEWKHLVHVRGQLFNEDNEVLLDIAASGFSGDFKWFDAEGKQLAYFFNGKFPHEYTHLFRDSHNDIVELAPDLSDDDKIRLLSVISFLFFNRLIK